MQEVRLGKVFIQDKNDNGYYEESIDKVRAEPGYKASDEIQELEKILQPYRIGLSDKPSLSRIEFFFHYAKAFESSRKGDVSGVLTHAAWAERASSDSLARVEFPGFYEDGLRRALLMALATGGEPLVLRDLEMAIAKYLSPSLDLVESEGDQFFDSARAFLQKTQHEVEERSGSEAAAAMRVRMGSAILVMAIEGQSASRRSLAGMDVESALAVFEDSMLEARKLSDGADVLAQEFLVSEFADRMLFMGLEGIENKRYFRWELSVWWTGWANRAAGFSEQRSVEAQDRIVEAMKSAYPSIVSDLIRIRDTRGHADEGLRARISF